MSVENLHARVTEYRKHLVLEILAEKSVYDQVRTSKDDIGVIGQIVIGSKEFVGISPEAYALLETVKPGRDNMGDLDWFKVDDGRYCFAWFGSPYRVVDPHHPDFEAAANFAVHPGEFVSVPNDVPDEAKEVIDADLDTTNQSVY
ncbi:MAG: hypothetical protein KDA57_13995 [Planctomycetales bacterium]|nr:hypothetical protein [Planctomycetales bacterium]